MKGVSVFVLLILLSAIAYVDKKQMRIPNRLLLVLIVWYPVQLYFMEWKDSLLGSVIGGGFFLLANLLSKGKVGMGDVKLMTVMGLYLGRRYIGECIFLSLFIAAAYGIGMMAVGKMGRNSCIPYAPFVMGAICIHYILALKQGGL